MPRKKGNISPSVRGAGRLALERLIAIGTLRTGAAFGGHIVRTAASVSGARGSKAFADLQNPLPVFVSEGHIKPRVGVMDAHEERCFAIVVLDQKAIGGSLDDVRVMRPARRAGAFALDRGETCGCAQDGVGFALESVAFREENGTRLFEIVGGDQCAGGKGGSLPVIAPFEKEREGREQERGGGDEEEHLASSAMKSIDREQENGCGDKEKNPDHSARVSAPHGVRGALLVIDNAGVPLRLRFARNGKALPGQKPSFFTVDVLA